jgi:hypothetical protein
MEKKEGMIMLEVFPSQLMPNSVMFYYHLKTQHIYQQLNNISKLWQHVSAIKSHHQAKIEQSLGTMKVCTLWDPMSFNDMRSHRVHCT